MENSHHATLIRCVSVRSQELPELCENIEIQDVYIERFGIDDARELVRNAHNRPIETSERVLVLRTDFITLEAQNALLKVLEEPPQSTRFVFVLPSGFTVLPTLASRFNEETANVDTSIAGENEAFDTFLSDSYKDRLASIDKAAKQKDIEWQRNVKQGLIYHIQQSSKQITSLQKLEYSTRTLLTRGASNKMLLEHVALILPTR